MVPRITQKGGALQVIIVTAAVIVIFVLLITRHYDIEDRDIQRVLRNTQNALVIMGNRAGLLDTCGESGDFTTFSSTVYVCNNQNTELVYSEIYNSYPASLDGQERIYTFLDQGTKERADEMLDDIYFIERYEPVTLTPPLTWTEDPFGERYWRFLFYSLRPIRHLIAVGEDTGDRRYYEKTREILESFADTGMNTPFSWDDGHGVAFRTMVLVNAWWKLREAGELPTTLSDKILGMLQEHGNFLMDPANYEADYNHGITQASALLILAESFPDLENAPIWRRTAILRIDEGLRDVIDKDGVLVENSPYYHFYVLEKYWEIYRYTERYGIEISDEFNSTIEAMINHATYILQPDLNMPLLGASIPREILRSGEFREIANEYPEFRYVITKGDEGERPSLQHIRFPSSGISVLRSGWGEERPYEDEMQVVFDGGPYRTDHSDLDALSFSAFSGGQRLVRDTGLFTYEEDHPFYTYFHGTRGHNTVMVDDTDQARGTGVTSEIESGEGYATISGYHDLYEGVRHNRALIAIEDKAVVIIDQLRSDGTHRYNQLFHLAPGTEITGQRAERVDALLIENGITTPISILQLGDSGNMSTYNNDTSNVRGLCADAYESFVGCPEISFEVEGQNANYVTVIHIGDAVNTYTAEYKDGTIMIDTPNRTYSIDIESPEEGVLDSPFITLTVDTSTKQGQPKNIIERIQEFIEEVF